MRIALPLLAVSLLAACATAPKQPARSMDPAMVAFETELKATITRQTVDDLRRESKFQDGYVMIQFHYQDGKILDANAVYLLGEKDLAREVVEQVMQVQAPPAIPEISGKRVRFILDFCFLPDVNDCLEREKRARAAVPPEPEEQ